MKLRYSFLLVTMLCAGRLVCTGGGLSSSGSESDSNHCAGGFYQVSDTRESGGAGESIVSRSGSSTEEESSGSDTGGSGDDGWEQSEGHRAAQPKARSTATMILCDPYAATSEDDEPDASSFNVSLLSGTDGSSSDSERDDSNVGTGSNGAPSGDGQRFLLLRITPGSSWHVRPERTRSYKFTHVAGFGAAMYLLWKLFFSSDKRKSSPRLNSDDRPAGSYNNDPTQNYSIPYDQRPAGSY